MAGNQEGEAEVELTPTEIEIDDDSELEDDMEDGGEEKEEELAQEPGGEEKGEEPAQEPRDLPVSVFGDDDNEGEEEFIPFQDRIPHPQMDQMDTLPMDNGYWKLDSHEDSQVLVFCPKEAKEAQASQEMSDDDVEMSKQPDDANKPEPAPPVDSPAAEQLASDTEEGQASRGAFQARLDLGPRYYLRYLYHKCSIHSNFLLRATTYIKI